MQAENVAGADQIESEASALAKMIEEMRELIDWSEAFAAAAKDTGREGERPNGH
jgi:hypothetical protein